jgi:hypothetical protein
MPKRKTSFDDDWLSDSRFSSWIVKCKTSDGDAYCSLCKKTFSVSNGGISQVQQHQEGTKHASLVSASKQQPRLLCACGAMFMESSKKVVLSQEEQISRAEILQLFRLIKYDQSFESCDDLVPVLRVSLSDPVAHDMSLCATKASYSIAYGLSPFFHEEVVSDMKNSWYSLIVDETATEQNVKQFDMHVRYWSAADDKIVRKYLASSFLGHARAEDLKKASRKQCRVTVCLLSRCCILDVMALM